MKYISKIMTLVMTAIIMIATAVPAFAQTIDTQAGGQGTITISNASQGQQYSIYKLFDATVGDGGIISYKLPDGKTKDNFGGGAWFDVDSKGNISAKPGADVSTPEFKTWAEGFGVQVGTTVTATDNTVVFQNVPYGYYFIKSSLGAILTVDSTNPSATVIDKNETKPSIPDGNVGGGKKVVDGAGTASSTATAKIGDTVNFRVKFVATNFVTEGGASKQITEYKIVDTPAGLNINKDSVQVKVGTAVITTATISKAADGKLTVTIPWVNGANSIYNSPSDVEVTYSAVVTKDAQEGTASNTAAISYTPKDGADTPIVPNNPGDTTTTISNYRFTLKKVNEQDATITGAQFRLYSAATNGEEIAVVKNTDGSYRVAEAGEQGVVIDAGTAVIKGLKGNTSYWLEETKAPNGYNILTERKEVAFAAANIDEVKVVNKAGTELPSTGAFGTKLFYLLGSLMVVGAMVILVSKRRATS